MASNLSTLEFNDIYADGYVTNQNWGNGWKFGTSFAAPRVSAEIVNLFDKYLTPMLEGETIEIDPAFVAGRDKLSVVIEGDPHG